MSNEEHRQGSLIETAREELERTHRGVLAMDASEVRRGLELALNALRGASGQTDASDPALPNPRLAPAVEKLSKALADLDSGSLAEMDTLIEDVRSQLA